MVTSLFVYGTLMPGQRRWNVLQSHAIITEPVTARGHLWDTGLGHPAARFDGTGDDIPGVLVRIRPDVIDYVIATLDRIEGEGVLYRRVEVSTSGGSAISYEWLGPTDGLLPLSGGW